MASPVAGIPEQADLPGTFRVEAALFRDLARWRERLARGIARDNLLLRSDGIATAVTRILFSLLFLRIAEDRGLVTEGTLGGIGNSSNRYGQLLEVTAPLAVLWEGGVGASPHDVVPMGVLVIDDRVLCEILTCLTSPDRPYQFGNMELEPVALVLARYLSGTIRRSAAHQADVVDTHETVVSCGAPVPDRSVLRYVAESTLAAARAGRSHRELLPIRILDPACGTGLLLLCAYRSLIGERGGGSLTPGERHEILMESVHGVDISRHAVAATQALLIFRLCESPSPLLGGPEGFLPFVAKVACELTYNIRCGNAVTGPEIVEDESWAFCPARERHRLNTLDWHVTFSEIFASGGFDAVICNPPEGLPDRKEWIQQYLQRHYRSYDPQAGWPAYFIERSLGLLRPGGTLGACTGDQWLRGKAGTPLRSLLAGRQIEELVDVPGGCGNDCDTGVCCVRLTNRTPSGRPRVTIAGPGFFACPAAYVRARSFPADRETFGQGGWNLRDTRVDAILAKVRAAGRPLEEYVMGEILPGLVGVPDPAFVMDARERKELVGRDGKTKALIRPIIAGAEIGRYEPALPASYAVFIPPGWTAAHPSASRNPWRWLRKRHPTLARFLKERAGERAVTREEGRHWWEIGPEAGTFRDIIPRILFPNRFLKPAFLYDSGLAVPGRGTVAISGASPYLAGILNSKLISFVLARSVSANGREAAEYSWEELRYIPVYTTDFDDPADAARHERIVRIVRRLIDLKKQLAETGDDQDRGILVEKADTADRTIDRIVYGLYRLTDDEIAIVETSIR